MEMLTDSGVKSWLSVVLRPAADSVFTGHMHLGRGPGATLGAPYYCFGGPPLRPTRTQAVDTEAGMAKYFASEIAYRHALESMRIYGRMGYSPELDVEPLYRNAPLMVIGEGSNEIMKMVIARGLTIGRTVIGWRRRRSSPGRAASWGRPDRLSQP